MDDFDNLITSNAAWVQQFEFALEELDNNATGQLELWPVEDFIAPMRYVPCPHRGTHKKLIECWMCWCDVTRGAATASQVLAPGAPGVRPLLAVGARHLTTDT